MIPDSRGSQLLCRFSDVMKRNGDGTFKHFSLSLSPFSISERGDVNKLESGRMVVKDTEKGTHSFSSRCTCFSYSKGSRPSRSQPPFGNNCSPTRPAVKNSTPLVGGAHSGRRAHPDARSSPARPGQEAPGVLSVILEAIISSPKIALLIPPGCALRLFVSWMLCKAQAA